MNYSHLYKQCGTSAARLALILIVISTLNSNALAKAKNTDFIMDTEDVGKTSGTVVSSDQFLELGTSTPSALRMEGEQALRMGNHDRALTVLQRSVEMAPMDMDGRILYSEALEKKLMRQHEKDPALYNFLVKQWLFVYKESEFPDQAVQGLQHLTILTGTQPKRFEKIPKFLSRVLVPEDGSTKVALGGRHTTDE